VMHKLSKDGETTVCGSKYTGNINARATWRSITCKRCLKKRVVRKAKTTLKCTTSVDSTTSVGVG
jgi:hypothetical protein